MNKKIMMLLLTLTLLLASVPAGAYTLEFSYGDEANHAYAYASNPQNSGVFVEEYGKAGAKAEIALDAPYSYGKAVVRQAGSQNGGNWIIKVQAKAGPTDDSQYFAYGYAFGNSEITFRIRKDAGDKSDIVLADVAYEVAGDIDYGNCSLFSYFESYLGYQGSLVNYLSSGTDLDLLKNWDQTFQGSQLQTSFQVRGEGAKLSFETDKDYVFRGTLDIDVQALGSLISDDGSATFCASFYLSNIQPVPVPPGIMLLGSGLLAVGLCGRKRG